MKLVKFGIDEDRNFIVQFPVFVQPYTQQQQVLYQIGTVPVPIIDQNKQVHSYTHLQIDRLYIALNSEMYISLRQQELTTCKKIGYEFYCEELFVVKHESNAIYFNLSSDTIKENCNFAYYFNKTYIKPTLLDGRNEIILANWPDDTHIVCNVNNDIPVKFPSFPHALVNRSVLCNSGIEAENNFQLGTLIFSGTEQFFPETQAFTSPPDMASSGVWENIILCKTPTFDGVCGNFFIYNFNLIIAKGLFVSNYLDRW